MSARVQGQIRHELILGAFSWLPYVLVAWIAAEALEESFWGALVVLFSARLFFTVIETLGGIVRWRLYGRSKMVESTLATLRSYRFPQRDPLDGDFSNYIARVEADERQGVNLRLAARELSTIPRVFAHVGMLAEARVHSAHDEALERYSPRTGSL